MQGDMKGMYIRTMYIVLCIAIYGLINLGRAGHVM